MKQRIFLLAGLMAGGIAAADDVSDADKLLCATDVVKICFESDECHSAMPWQLDMPEFVKVDTKKKLLSTTKASGLDRTTPILTLHRTDGKLVLQGFENGRAFSVIIEESIGTFSAAIARDGAAVSAFGSCTDIDNL